MLVPKRADRRGRAFARAARSRVSAGAAWRSHQLYGLSPVEQVALTVNIALRREQATLDYYNTGSLPDSFATLQKDWTVDQIRHFQDYFDALMSGNLSRRRMVKFMPAEFRLTETRQPPLKDQYDEWLARVICYAFSISLRVSTMPGIRNRSSLRLDGAVLTFAGREIGRADAFFDETKVKALIAAAFGTKRAVSAAGYIAGALKRSGEGDQVLALIHLALADLPPLTEEKDADWRVAEAERLMASGVSASSIFTALASDDAALLKHTADQPRVPAGSGRVSGQWTAGEGGDASVAGGATVDEARHSSDYQMAAADTSQKCADYIAANRRGSVLRVFPGQS